MFILIYCVCMLLLTYCVYADDNIKLYINNDEIKDRVIVDNKNTYLSLDSIFNNIGGSYNWNKETNEVDITYNEVTYSFKHNNKWNAFPDNVIDSDKIIGNFVLSVTNNPKNHLVKDIKNGTIKYGKNKFCFYVLKNKLYFRCDDNFKLIMNLLGYQYRYSDSINIDEVNYNYDYFLTNLKANMELDEVNKIISPDFHAGRYFKDLNTFIVRYYLQNDSIVELEFNSPRDEDSVTTLKHMRHFTSNNDLIALVF